MFPNYVETIMNQNGDCDIIRARSLHRKIIIRHKGGIYIKKPIFLKYGGFRPWLCAADAELYHRLKDIETIKDIDDILSYRNVHMDSLTMNDETGMKSKLRSKYHQFTRNEFITCPEDAIIDCVTNTYKEITSPSEEVIDKDEYLSNIDLSQYFVIPDDVRESKNRQRDMERNGYKRCIVNGKVARLPIRYKHIY
jgi:hypothetical protein